MWELPADVSIQESETTVFVYQKMGDVTGKYQFASRRICLLSST